MKKILLFLLISTCSFSQDFTEITTITSKYTRIKNVNDLAQKIDADFSSDENKVKAIYVWLANNIRYNLDKFYNPSSRRTSFRYRTEEERIKILQEIKDKTVNTTIKEKKGICENYAQTFTKLCTLLGIESEVIKGYARFGYMEIGKPKTNTNHAWNAVKINNKWIYLDATWGAGHVINNKWEHQFKPYYYNIPKVHYFKTHLPESSLWRLRVGRMEKEDFYSQPIYSDAFFNSGVTLKKPTKGILEKDKLGRIHIELKDTEEKSFLFGFKGSKIAKRPNIIKKGKTTLINIIPPKNAKLCYVLIDGNVALQFLIK